MSLLLTMLLCCPPVNAQTVLTAEDVKFLRGCNVEQADIDVIPNLSSDGQEKLQLVLESSRRNCSSAYIQSFKATRDYLKRLTPPPKPEQRPLPLPPQGYDRSFLTPAEVSYVISVNEMLFKKR